MSIGRLPLFLGTNLTLIYSFETKFFSEKLNLKAVIKWSSCFTNNSNNEVLQFQTKSLLPNFISSYHKLNYFDMSHLQRIRLLFNTHLQGQSSKTAMDGRYCKLYFLEQVMTKVTITHSPLERKSTRKLCGKSQQLQWPM